MGEFITAGEGDFFVQEEWSEIFDHLTCVGVGDLPLPSGDLTPQYCPDPAQKGKFKVDGFIQDEPGTPTTTLTKPLSPVANWLLEQSEMGCAFNFWATYGCGGTRGNPENYDIAVLGFGARVSNSRILGEAVAMQPSDEARVMTDAEISYQARKMFYQLYVARQTVINTAAANGIAFLPQACASRCAPARKSCWEGYMALDGTMYNSEVKYTKNGGGTWAQTATDPFTYSGGDASDVVVFETANGGHRAVVARGSVTEGEPAEIAYTEDWGATWHNVDVGAVNDQYITDLFSYGGEIFAVCTGGYIYVSSDLGDTWTALESGDETVQMLNSIAMYSSQVGYAVGNNNAFLYTTDGDEWNARTGPAAATNLLSVAVNGEGHVFVGAADGSLYRSEDGGVTWPDEDVRNFGTGSIDFIAFDTDLRYVGLLIYNTAGGVGTMYRSHDGGASWQAPTGQTTGWNSGLNAGHICDQNHFFVVGEAHGGTTFVAKANPMS